MPTKTYPNKEKSKDNRQVLLDLISKEYGVHNAVVMDKALKTQDKQIEEAMMQGGLTANDIGKSFGADLKALGNRTQSQLATLETQPTPAVAPALAPAPAPQSSSPTILPAKGLFSPAQQLPTGQIQEGGGLSWIGGHSTSDLLKRMLYLSQIQKQQQNQNLSPEQLAEQLNSYNAALPPEYQALQTAEGKFIAHPKSGGLLAQLTPEQMDTVSNSMLAGETAPSQLPRGQRMQAMVSALQKNPEYNPAKADIDFAVNKVGASNFEKLYNNVTSFERTFRKNADVALALSDKFDRSKVPLLNKAIMAGKLNITGDPEASRMLVSLYTVATEYARLTSSPGATGSQITDSAREEARSMLNAWQNQGTIRGLLDPKTGIMSIDAQNRLDALNETKTEIQGRISPKSKQSHQETDNKWQKFLKITGRSK